MTINLPAGDNSGPLGFTPIGLPVQSVKRVIQQSGSRTGEHHEH